MTVAKTDILIKQGSAADRAAALLRKMTLAEKIGQMSQVHAEGLDASVLSERLRAGQVGSVINTVDVGVVNELQRIAVEESRLGIPLLVGRDVIHGFKTVFPIPLGQAATWNPEIVREGARVAALEASKSGVNWTFAPMIDISRDPRWGRIAESLGECVLLTSRLGAAMVHGFQGDSLADGGSIAACAKHFAGYGAVESGRDYATTNIPDTKLRNVYFRPFEAAVAAGVSAVPDSARVVQHLGQQYDQKNFLLMHAMAPNVAGVIGSAVAAGVSTFMTSFSDLNGVPATGNSYILSDVLRGEWAFNGFVVSDWDSIRQLQIHGLTGNDRESACEAVAAGVDMEMAGDAYGNHLLSLVEEGRISEARIDEAALRILSLKFELGLFDNPYTDPGAFPAFGSDRALAAAKKAALQSAVLLKNDNGVLPLGAPELSSLAIIGPLADAPYEQLGTWIFDGDQCLSVTPLQAIRELVGDEFDVRFVRAMENSRSRVNDEFDVASRVAGACDAALLFLGEESILSGEAHSRADISLPGDQAELVRRVRAAGKPVIAVILAGRRGRCNSLRMAPGNDGRPGAGRHPVRERVPVRKIAHDISARGRADPDLLQPEEWR